MTDKLKAICEAIEALPPTEWNGKLMWLVTHLKSIEEREEKFRDILEGIADCAMLASCDMCKNRARAVLQEE